MGYLRAGFVRDDFDSRDLNYGDSAGPFQVDAPMIGASADLRSGFGDPFDQGQTESCTGNTAAAMVMFEQVRHGLPTWTPSRLWLYYMARKIDGTAGVDGGAQLRSIMKVLAGQGVPPEADWPFDATKVLVEPPGTLDDIAKASEATSYYRLDNTDVREIKACLAAGNPFMFGIDIFPSFYSAPGGDVDLPGVGEVRTDGHALIAVGYDDATGRVAFRNSWGQSWGDGGYGTIPYAYLTSGALAFDFWTVRNLL